MSKKQTKKCAHAQISMERSQKQNAAATYNIFFFVDFWQGQNMENYVASKEILCTKNSGNFYLCF